MTQKTAKPKAQADNTEITLDRDITIAGEAYKKGDKVTVSKATADWIANLPKPTNPATVGVG